MDLYLAGMSPFGGGKKDTALKKLIWTNKFNMLESFLYIKDWQKEWIKTDNCLNFMLDSGIFTFAQGAGGFDKINIEQYADKYIDFINKHNIDKFIEFDLDSNAVLPLGKVEELRHKIEKGTGRPCIPAWHWNRGLRYWEKMCEEYDYVAIGTDTRVGKKSNLTFYNSLTKYAHKHGCKVHMLGFSMLKEIDRVDFDSCDSISWMSGAIYTPKLYTFTGTNLISTPIRKHIEMDWIEKDCHNIVEWIKYSNYLKDKKQCNYNECLSMFGES